MEQKTKEKIQWQCNVNTSERTFILRPDHVKKSTQQSLCINFVRRRSSATLCSVKLNCSWHCFTRVISDVLNSFKNSRLITESNDWVRVLFRGHASRPYNKTVVIRRKTIFLRIRPLWTPVRINTIAIIIVVSRFCFLDMQIRLVFLAKPRSSWWTEVVQWHRVTV